MKQHLRKPLLLILVLLTGAASSAQDIPLFSQKLTNSFIYNPAMAGHSMGSLTYSYRRNYSGVSGAPETHFLSLHTPLLKQRFGTGVNVFQEDVNFLRNTFASVAFAYHVQFNRFSILSFGVSGEYNTIRLNGATNTPAALDDPEYLRLANGDVNDIDFSFGANFQTRLIKVGVAANRLATAWIKDDSASVLSSYYSGYVQGMIPLREGKDLLEPYVAFRNSLNRPTRTTWVSTIRITTASHSALPHGAARW
ncbi:MAG: PorP/SprF family type IX secretion system membrane protein [Bacteroidia bacterium]|nr:PorP/SprF family type IX secretion system membrane protein [Bacteroidia bacterium]